MRNKPQLNAFKSKQSWQQINKRPKAVHDSCEGVAGALHVSRAHLGVRNAIHWARLICIQSHSIVGQRQEPDKWPTLGLWVLAEFISDMSLIAGGQLGIDRLLGGALCPQT